MKIVIASDSFKGSMSSVDVAQAAAKGIREVLPDSQVVAVNVATSASSPSVYVSSAPDCPVSISAADTNAEWKNSLGKIVKELNTVRKTST